MAPTCRISPSVVSALVLLLAAAPSVASPLDVTHLSEAVFRSYSAGGGGYYGDGLPLNWNSQRAAISLNIVRFEDDLDNEIAIAITLVTSAPDLFEVGRAHYTGGSVTASIDWGDWYDSSGALLMTAGSGTMTGPVLELSISGGRSCEERCDTTSAVWSVALAEVAFGDLILDADAERFFGKNAVGELSNYRLLFDGTTAPGRFLSDPTLRFGDLNSSRVEFSAYVPVPEPALMALLSLGFMASAVRLRPR